MKIKCKLTPKEVAAKFSSVSIFQLNLSLDAKKSRLAITNGHTVSNIYRKKSDLFIRLMASLVIVQLLTALKA